MQTDPLQVLVESFLFQQRKVLKHIAIANSQNYDKVEGRTLAAIHVQIAAGIISCVYKTWIYTGRRSQLNSILDSLKQTLAKIDNARSKNNARPSVYYISKEVTWQNVIRQAEI